MYGQKDVSGLIKMMESRNVKPGKEAEISNLSPMDWRILSRP